MRKIIILIILLFPCLAVGKIQKKISIKIFAPLDKDAAENFWGMKPDKQAKIFEKIYKSYNKNKQFKKVLLKYADSSDKCYWIGVYLHEKDYTSINNFQLSMVILEKGLKISKDEREKIGFYFVIGNEWYKRGKKKKALSYFIPGYKLSKKYIGCVPSLWKTTKEAEFIMNMIKDSIK